MPAVFSSLLYRIENLFTVTSRWAWLWLVGAVVVGAVVWLYFL
jgi:hypothetical protein